MLSGFNEFLDDYEKNGFRVSIEIPQRELWKLFSFIVGTVIFVVLAQQLLKGLFNNK